MKIGKACAIFMQIDSDKYTVEEKGTAIYEVLQMPTHNGITKGNMLSVINFLLRLAFDVRRSPRRYARAGASGVTPIRQSIATGANSGRRREKMIKTHVASRFELRSLDGIRDASDVILQAEQTGSTFTGSNKAVYLCEVVRSCDYSRTTTADKLAAEIERVNADNRALRKKVERLEKALQKERAKNE